MVDHVVGAEEPDDVALSRGVDARHGRARSLRKLHSEGPDAATGTV